MSQLGPKIGSALSGAAQNIVWLIVCRAVQGLGGGGIMQLVMIIISDIVPLQKCISFENDRCFFRCV